MTIQIVELFGLFGFVRRSRNADGKTTAGPQFRLDAHLGAMPVEDVLDDCQAKASAAARAAFLHIDAVEALGQSRQMHFGNARTEIAHGKLAIFAEPAARDLDDLAARGIFDGVLDEVLDDLDK